MQYIFVLAVVFSCVVVTSADLCAYQPTGNSKCLDCTTNMQSGGQCGWCAPTMQCLQGNDSGPSNGFSCNVGWYFLVPGIIPVSTCPNCNASRSCLTCNQNPECAWCGNDNTCYAIDMMPPTCMAVHDAGCPCEERTQCSDCVNGPSCVFCSKPQYQCVPVATEQCADEDKIDHCGCSNYGDCNSCQSQEPCFWCAKTKTCEYYNQTSCTPTYKYCPAKSGGFDGGSYFGGMMTVVGIVAVGGIAYFGYRYYKDHQVAGYEPISS